MKRYNISRKLYEELVKGNEYVLKNGSVVDKDCLLKRIKKEYINGVRDGSIDMTLSYQEYVEYQLNKATKCEDILKLLKNKYGIDYKEG